jgi:F-type H+-transporting ATPase subunit epsilon
MAKLKLEIVTPEAKIYSDDVDTVVLPGSEGDLGPLPEHAPLLTALSAGELHVMKDGKETVLAVGEGFVEITPTTVSVLTDMAVAEGDIDETAAEAAIKRAQEALKDDQISDEDMASAQAVMMKSLAQLKVKRRKKV